MTESIEQLVVRLPDQEGPYQILGGVTEVIVQPHLPGETVRVANLSPHQIKVDGFDVLPGMEFLRDAVGDVRIEQSEGLK